VGYEHYITMIDLFSRLCAETDCKLFTILDAARHKDIYTQIRAAENRSNCLYAGSLTQELESAAPWLVDLDRAGDAFTEFLAHEAFGDSWGIFFLSSASLKDLRKHFRQFLLAKREDGTQVYFRYYDPRVTRIYLPTCNPEELKHVYGPVHSFLMEGRQPSDTIVQFAHAGGTMTETVHALAGEPAPAAPVPTTPDA
jgi:hypothetical protein